MYIHTYKKKMLISTFFFPAFMHAVDCIFHIYPPMKKTKNNVYTRMRTVECIYKHMEKKDKKNLGFRV